MFILYSCVFYRLHSNAAPLKIWFIYGPLRRRFEAIKWGECETDETGTPNMFWMCKLLIRDIENRVLFICGTNTPRISTSRLSMYTQTHPPISYTFQCYIFHFDWWERKKGAICNRLYCLHISFCFAAAIFRMHICTHWSKQPQQQQQQIRNENVFENTFPVSIWMFTFDTWFSLRVVALIMSNLHKIHLLLLLITLDEGERKRDNNFTSCVLCTWHKFLWQRP